MFVASIVQFFRDSQSTVMPSFDVGVIELQSESPADGHSALAAMNTAIANHSYDQTGVVAAVLPLGTTSSSRSLEFETRGRHVP